MHIVHINTARTWSGGEDQTLKLIGGLKKLPTRNTLIAQCDSPVANKAKSVGAKVVEITMRGEWDIFAAWKIAGFLRKDPPDIIQVHTSHAHTLAILAGKISGAKNIVVTRRMDFPIKGLFSRVKYNCASEIAAISQAAKRALVKGGVNSDKITIIPDAVQIPENISRGTIRDEFQIAKDDIVLATIACLVQRKGHTYIFEAVKTLLQSFSTIKLLVVGEGAIADDLKKLACDMEIQNEVIFTGYRNDIANILSSTDIFVSAALMEGLGVSILEAGSYGLPIVASETGGIPDIIKNQETGLLFKPGDSKDLADKLRFMLENKQKAQQMGQSANRWIGENFSVEKVVASYFQLYQNMLDRQKNH